MNLTISKLELLIECVRNEIYENCHSSSYLKEYDTRTVDIIHEKTNMEICSISNRIDYGDNKVLEVAIGTDRCIYLFNN